MNKILMCSLIISFIPLMTYGEYTVWDHAVEIDQLCQQYRWPVNVELRLVKNQTSFFIAVYLQCELAQEQYLMAVGAVVGYAGTMPFSSPLQQKMRQFAGVIFGHYAENVAYISAEDCRTAMTIKDDKEAGAFIATHLHFIKKE